MCASFEATQSVYFGGNLMMHENGCVYTKSFWGYKARKSLLSCMDVDDDDDGGGCCKYVYGWMGVLC